jgi:hypothetical protein
VNANPFREKAERARAMSNSLNRETPHDKAMRESFPLGGGYGRSGGSKRMEVSVNRACAAVNAVSKARYLEAKADAFDRGEINAQGRAWNANKQASSEKREAQAEKRKARQEAARAEIAERGRECVSPETWADAAGCFGGGARALLMGEHAERYPESALKRAGASDNG